MPAPALPGRPRPAATGPSLCVVGAGPTAIGVLERLVANAPELSAGARLTVHLVDPHPAGRRPGLARRAVRPAVGQLPGR